MHLLSFREKKVGAYFSFKKEKVSKRKLYKTKFKDKILFNALNILYKVSLCYERGVEDVAPYNTTYTTHIKKKMRIFKT